MTLTQQFLLVSILPLTFLGMVVHLWRAKHKQRRSFWRWTATLFIAAVWASSLLRFYGGVQFAPSLVFSWAIVGNYALTLLGTAVLLTTTPYLSVPTGPARLTTFIGLLFWAGGLALDPLIWPYRLPDLAVGERVITHASLWAAVWVTSWVVPLLAAWLFTRRARYNLPSVHYLNQVQYWSVVLILAFIGFGLASVGQQNQIFWQEAGVFGFLLAAYAGTISLANGRLPDLQLTLRRLLSRLSGTLVIFVLAWWGLNLVVQGVVNLPDENGRSLILLLAAALFAGVFTFLYRLVNDITRRLFLPATARLELDIANYANTIGNLPEPTQLGQLFLRMIQSSLTTDDAWFFLADEAPAGKLVLRPLAGLGTTPHETVDFEPNSPFATQLRQNHAPLSQYDLVDLSLFDQLPPHERTMIEQWGHVLFMPLHAGDSLIGVLALGPKYSGESYNRQDLHLLQVLATQIGPLLAQARNFTSMRQITNHVYRQNQSLTRDKHHLTELSQLYTQFMQLLSPDLRKPFNGIGRSLQKLQEELPQPTRKQQQALTDLNKQVEELKRPLEGLITTAARIQSRHHFQFQPVMLPEIIEIAIRNLHSMSEARRIRIEFTPNSAVPMVYGDRPQLLEAIQQLLHNAVKFNKIGGSVRVDCGTQGSELYLHVIDTGVGIPPERLTAIWDGLTKLNQNGAIPNTGFALSLVRFIIAAHGGRVEAQSKYGSGSTFSFYLPMIFEEIA